MPRKNSGVKAAVPKNVFLKPMTFDFKGLFKGLAKGVGHASIGKWEELASDAVETLSALGLATDPEELAFLLIKRSAIRAIFDLVDESARLFEPDKISKPDDLVSELHQYTSKEELSLTASSLPHPRTCRWLAN